MQAEHVQIVAYLASAWVAGSLVGLERTYSGRAAGFRTHALVCMASALLMMVTTHQWQWLVNVPLDTIRADPTRMAQGIMTGIGFLGAGVIFKEGLTVRGLTTAASIWTTAALGILFGIGLFYPAVLATAATLGTLGVFRLIESRMPSHYYANHVLSFPRDHVLSEPEVRSLLADHGFTIATMNYRLNAGGTVFDYRMVIKTVNKANLQRLAETLRSMEHVLEFRIYLTSD